LVTIVYAGPFVDRHGGRRILLTGLILGAVALCGLAATSNLFIIGLFNALHGVASAAILVPTLAIIAEVAPERVRGREMGTFNFVNMFGWVLGFGLGFILSGLFPTRLWITFLIAGGFALLGFVYAAFNLRGDWRATKSPEQVSVETFRVVLGNGPVLLLTIPWFILFLFIASVIAFQGQTLGGFSPFLVALAIIVGGSLFILSQVFYGWLSDRFGRNPLMIAGATGFLALTLLAAWATFVNRNDAVLIRDYLLSPGPLLIAVVALAVGLMFPPAGLAALVDVAEEMPKGIVMSVYTVTLSLGFAIGPWFSGALWEAYHFAGVITFFVFLAVAFLLVLLYRAKGPRLAVFRSAVPR
jgi:MFS family permease